MTTKELRERAKAAARVMKSKNVIVITDADGFIALNAKRDFAGTIGIAGARAALLRYSDIVLDQIKEFDRVMTKKYGLKAAKKAGRKVTKIKVTEG